MIHRSKDIQVNYAARILRVESIEPIPDAHSIVRAVLGTNKIVVSKDMQVRDLVVYFPLGSVLCEKYLKTLNSYSDYHLNDNVDEYEALQEKIKNQTEPSEILVAQLKGMKGLFDKSGRVRMQKLRGQYSEGYVVPVSTLEKVWPDLVGTDWDKLEGETFDMVGEDLLCWKYVPVMKSISNRSANDRRPRRKEKKFDRIIPNQFAFHYDTNHLDRNAHMILPTDSITLTVKEHGTAFQMANILTNKKLSGWELFKKFLGFPVATTEYGNVFSSRRVIQNKYYNPKFKPENSFYGGGVYECANRDLHRFLIPGMTVYGELVGYKEGTSTCIQSPKGIDHDYGCKKGTWSFMPYRITKTDAEGKVVDEWDVESVIQWAEYVKELLSPEDKHKIHPMTLVYEGPAGDMYGLWSKIQKKVTKKKFEEAKAEFLTSGSTYGLPAYLETLEKYRIHIWQIEWIEAMKHDKVMLGFEEPEPLCHNPKAPREGVVLRITGDPIARAWKLKTLAHKNLSQKSADAGEVDMDDMN